MVASAWAAKLPSSPNNPIVIANRFSIPWALHGKESHEADSTDADKA
jgi:hypothetical protein